jgi:hypothetical protein
MTTELIETAIPTQISFQIGNAEISNLLVQNEVLRIEGEIAALTVQTTKMTARFKQLLSGIKADVIDMATELWAEKLWTVADICQELTGGAPLDRDGWDIVFEWEPLWIVASTDRDVHKDPTSVTLKTSFQKVTGDSVEYLSVPIGWRRDGLINIILSSDVKSRITEGQNLYDERAKLNSQAKALRGSIKDTSKIEKRVLAALTQNSIANNPELVAQLQGVVTMIGSDQLLLTAS